MNNYWIKSLKNAKITLPLFLFCLFIVNLIQGNYSELLADEAYYWVYSNYLDFGYFDHPPMVAIWCIYIKTFI